MSIKTEITRLQNAKASIKTAIEGKGVAVPDGTKLDGMAALVDSISSGGGSSSETWVLNLSGVLTSTFTGISFVSNGATFSSITKGGNGRMKFLKYDNTNVCGATPYAGDVPGIAWESAMWVNTAYRKLTFSTPPSGDLLTWLEANAVKQANDTAVQTDKAITITSNGTTKITPDAPYDGLSSVDVTVDVASGVGTCKLTINVTTPPSDDPEWYIDFFPVISTGEYITIDANNQSAEIALPNNEMFALVTYYTIDYVDTSDWGIFDASGVSVEYVKNPNITRTYICYAGETGNGTWDVVFR